MVWSAGILERRPILQLCTGHGLVLSKLVTSPFSHHAALIVLTINFIHRMFTNFYHTAPCLWQWYNNLTRIQQQLVAQQPYSVVNNEPTVLLSWFQKPACPMTVSRLLHPSCYDTCLKCILYIPVTKHILKDFANVFIIRPRSRQIACHSVVGQCCAVQCCKPIYGHWFWDSARINS